MAVSMKKHEMPTQDPKVRAHNFDEVALGYDEETALAEAARCLHCKVPQCRKGCPVSVDIPSFIALIKEKDYAGAVAKIKESNALPAVCGRVCPQENQCEKYCILGRKGESVGIGRLERFVADRKNRRRVRKRSLSSGRVPLGFPVQVISPSAAMMSQSLKHFIRLAASFPTVYRNSVFQRKRSSRKKSMPSKSSASSLNSIPSLAAFTRSMN